MSVEKDKKILKDVYQFKELEEKFTGKDCNLFQLFNSDILSIKKDLTNQDSGKFCLELTDNESNQYYLSRNSFYFSNRMTIFDGPSHVSLEAPIRNRYIFKDLNRTLNIWFINQEYNLNLPDNYLNWSNDQLVLLRLIK